MTDVELKQLKGEIEREFNRLKNTRMAKSPKAIAIEKCGFYLPDEARFDSINEAPDDARRLEGEVLARSANCKTGFAEPAQQAHAKGAS